MVEPKSLLLWSGALKMSMSKRTSSDFIEFFSELHENNFILLRLFQNLLKYVDFDCILSVENKSYPVHKLVLASCSPFFAVSKFFLSCLQYYCVGTYLGTMHGYILSGSMTSIWERLLRFHGFYSCSLSSFWVLELRSVCSQYPFHFATKNSKHGLRSWDFHVVFLLLYFYFIKESLNETVFFMIEGRSLYSNIVSWAPIG